MKTVLSKLIRGERGQGLVIVLCLLAIGSLTIPPLLSHMHSGLSSGRIHWESVPLRYASEAGLEDGIWKADNEEVSIDLYDYVTEYDYSLTEDINDKAVDVTIKRVWPLAGLESDVNGTTPANGLRITGGIVNTEGRYEIRVSYDFPEEELLIDQIAVWLPPEFEYVADSTTIITTDNPTQTDWNGGTVLRWAIDPATNFLDLPDLGGEDPLEGGFQPAVEHPTVKVLRFEVTPIGEVAFGSYSWVRTTDNDKYLSWEGGLSIYHITSTATDVPSGRSITTTGYTYVSEGVDTGWLDTGGTIFTGDYRAVGNTLMKDLNWDRRRETHLDESSMTIADIPQDGEVALAYLYWSGWWNQNAADTTCTFRINRGETIRPNEVGDYTQCLPVGDSPNYQCVDDVVVDDDSTYVRTGHEYEILRPDGSGTYTQCDAVGDSPNHQCVDEETADDDSTYVRTWYGSTEMDTYNLADHSQGSDDITSVTVVVRTRGTSSGHAAQTVIRTHNVNYYGTYTVVPTSYTDLSTTYETNPNTGVAWTWGEVDALQAGVRQYDLNGGYLCTTQVYIGVEYGGVEGDSVVLRPNAAGDETNITYQGPSSGAHWDKVDEATADDFSTYVYTTDTPTYPPNWYDTDWQYRKEITVDHSEVEANLTGFPVLISVTDGDLRDHAKSDGSDILFTSSDGTTKLKREIESYDDSDGILVAWVKADLSSTADTMLYIYYGNPAASETNDTDTWDTSFVGVWHLDETTGGTNAIEDSAPSNNHGTDQGNPTLGATGKIDGAVGLDGYNDYIYTANSFVNPQEFTIEAWFKTNTASGKKIVGFENVQSGQSASSWDRHIYVGTEGRLYFGCYSGATDVANSTATYTDNVWHHVVGVRDDTTDTLHLYVDGSEVDTTANSNAEDFTGYFRIGSYRTSGWPDGVNGYFTGYVDEVRISTTVRDAAWIETSYNNQSAPGSFYDVGDEEAITGAYERDLYNIPDYSDVLSVTRVTVYFRFSGDHVGVDDYAGYARAAIKTNGTVYLGSIESQTGQTFVTESFAWTSNPDTGAPWTWSEIANLQVGVELTGTATTQAYCTQVYAEVSYGYSDEEEQVDTYNFEDHSEGGGTIQSVTVHVRTKGSMVEDAHAVETIIRTHDTNYYGTYTLLPISYTDLSTTYTENPYTEAAWTWEEVDALQAGVKHYDQGLGGVFTTNVYIEVDYGLFYEEEITADTWWIVSNQSYDYAYSSFKDVSSIVASVAPNGNATYTVGGVDGDTGSELSYAGWSLIVIYSSIYEEGHQFYLYDTLTYAAGSYDVPATGGFVIEGFTAPQDAEATLTCFVGEGDYWYDGDSLQFNGYYMSDAVNPEDDIWNSTSSALGGELIEGVDIDSFDVSSPIIEPEDTSAQVDFVTYQDAWNLIYLILSFRCDFAVLTPSSTGIYSYGF
jgi:hypothetical protein